MSFLSYHAQYCLLKHHPVPKLILDDAMGVCVHYACAHSIELNIFWMLRLTAASNLRFLIANATSFFSFEATLIVEQPAQNPCWFALKCTLLKVFHRPLCSGLLEDFF